MAYCKITLDFPKHSCSSIFPIHGVLSLHYTAVMIPALYIVSVGFVLVWFFIFFFFFFYKKMGSGILKALLFIPGEIHPRQVNCQHLLLNKQLSGF